MLAIPNALTAKGPANWFVPSLKVTEPVVTAAPPLVTVAVTVTVVPNVDGFGVDVTLVVGVAALTVCESAAEVLPLKRLSPPSEAMTQRAARGSVAVGAPAGLRG